MKTEYLIEWPRIKEESDAHRGGGGGGGEEQGVGSRKRRRGMNKRREIYRPECGVKLCAAVVAGRPCSYGDSCKFSHDLDAFAADRPPDLGERCPIYSLHGFCRFGVTCRFAGAHLQQQPPPDGRTLTVEMNAPPPELQARMRKQAYDFSRADAVSSRVLAEVQAALAQSGSAAPAPPPALAPAPAPAPASSSDTDAGVVAALHARERKVVDFRGKLYLAPLTTVGNLPFRRVCKGYGVDITCGEMAMATNLLQGHASEWALLRRHPCEDIFGVQIAGNQPAAMGRVAQLIEETCTVDFLDVNMGCPIDMVCNRGCGAGLACKPARVQSVMQTMSQVLSCPLTVKMRTGYEMHRPTAHKLIGRLPGWGAAAVTLHGRSRQQRYSKLADWDYIRECAPLTGEAVPLIGNGDVFSFEDLDAALREDSTVSAVIAHRFSRHIETAERLTKLRPRH